MMARVNEGAENKLCSNEPFIRSSTNKNDVSGVMKRTPMSSKERGFADLSRSNNDLIDIQNLGTSAEKPRTTLLRPQSSGKDKPAEKGSFFPLLCKPRAKQLPAASEHFNTVASEMLEKTPIRTAQHGKEPKKVQAKKVPGETNTRRADSKDRHWQLEDHMAAMRFSPSPRLSRSQDCLRRKALLRPATVGFSSKSAPTSPVIPRKRPQITKSSSFTSTRPSSPLTVVAREDPERRGSYTPPVSPSLRRKFETTDQTVRSTRILIANHRRSRPSSPNGTSARNEVHAKSLSEALEEVKNCRYLRIVKKQ